jgi:predicted alpha-1,2-mannosidase
LIAPDVQLDCVRSLVEMAKIGGALPRWPSGGGYTGSMFGSPADMVVAETYLKGLTDFDAEAAYAFMKKASEQGMPGGVDGRWAVAEYNQYGYVPADVETKGSVSSTLEYAWADGSIALLGQALGKDAGEVQYYKDKSMRYKNLFDPGTKYFRPKNTDGSWVTPFSPYITSYYNEVLFFFPKAYAEGGPQHYRWSVPQDPQGLIELFGSREYFVKELDKFMGSASKTMAAIDPGPGYWHGNQHNLHALYLFNEAGRPDLTQKWARWALTERYGTGPDGLDGNDDAGALSAWYVLSALGIYPVAGSDRWWIGAPIVDSAVLNLGGGKTLTVTAHNQSAKNIYVQSVTLNGARLTEPWVLHGALTARASNILVFEMGPKPAAGGGY